MKKKVVVIGGTFSPPGEHHRQLALHLQDKFDQIIIVPCGPRPDRPVVNDVEPIYRAAMADMAFLDLPKTTVDLFDLEENQFTRTHRLQEKYQSQGEVWHAVASDLVHGGKKKKSIIHQEWEQGEKLWNQYRFLVLKRPKEKLNLEDCPPHSEVFEMPMDGSSENNRKRLFERQNVDGFVPTNVLEYIQRHGLYRGTRPSKTTQFQLGAIRPLLLVDEQNPEAVKIRKQIPYQNTPSPNVILVIGGDGFMLKAIRQHWRKRLPYLGINAGRLGFLLNESPQFLAPPQTLTLHQLPLLLVETETTDAKHNRDFAFNDAWLERATGQTAHFKIKINQKEKIKLASDAVLISTPAGSASYARAMGAPPLPINTQALLLVGSNVLRPYGWKCAILPEDTCIEIEGLEPVKRPVQGYIDGVPQGTLQKMTMRASRVASVELLFNPKNDPAEKLGKIQFSQ